jgi:NAD(P)-dependent dehydrogenase (short-subunit alcohol dehydrogenase family)
MRGKVVLITGATSGIGLATAQRLAAAGATIAMVGHDPTHAEPARQQVAAEAADPGQVDLLIADLSSLAEVRRLADDVTSRFDHLDVLLNDAGVDVGTRMTTVDGNELTFAVNYLAPFVLTTSLRPLLAGGPPARVLNVVSSGHRGGKIDLDDLQGSGTFSGQRAYNNSKLALVLFTYELARRQAGTGVTANCVDPGFVRGTELGRTLPRGYQVIGTLLTPFMTTPAKAAEGIAWAAAAPELDGTTGAYFKRRKQVRSSAPSNDPELARRLWEATEALVDR